MDALLIIAAIIAAVIGVNCLTQATLGVGILAVACLLGILARLAQASVHNKESKESARKILEQSETQHEEIKELLRISIATSLPPTTKKPTDTPAQNVTPPPTEKPSTYVCPTCKIPMVIKVATQGPNQGKSFHVCPNFKECKQSLPVAVNNPG